MTQDEDRWWSLARAFGSMSSKKCSKCGQKLDSTDAVEIKRVIGESFEMSWVCNKCYEKIP